MNNKLIQICILGGGFGGLYTALYFSRFAWVKSGRCQITLVEKNDRFLFTPLLYELLTGELQPWEIAPSYQKLLINTKINFCQEIIQDVDLNNRQVNLENGQKLSYDYLVLAVGCQNRWANIPGLETHALTFRTLRDVERLQAKLNILEASERQYRSIAVIGGGPNGVELACKLADRLGKRGEIHLIEIGTKILQNFSSGVSSAAYRAIASRPIQLHLRTRVKAIDADSITVVCDDNIITFPVDLVLWTAGTEAREWVNNLDCQKNSQGKLLTRSTLQLLDYPEVLALGDLAEIHNKNKPIPATAQAAYQQASFASKTLIALIQNKKLRRFCYLYLGDMLTLGVGSAVVSSFFLNIEGALAAIIRRLVYIQRLPTFRHRMQVLKNLFYNILIKIQKFISKQIQQIFSHKSAETHLQSSKSSEYRR
jgi:NADH dehydrogenase